jgi:hypothetical protein
MAFYIMLVKESEDEQGVVYQFASDFDHLGKIYLDKSNGEIKKIQQLSDQQSEHLFTRAGVKLRQHWKAGFFPDKTCWAS